MKSLRYGVLSMILLQVGWMYASVAFVVVDSRWAPANNLNPPSWPDPRSVASANNNDNINNHYCLWKRNHHHPYPLTSTTSTSSGPGLKMVQKGDDDDDEDDDDDVSLSLEAFQKAKEQAKAKANDDDDDDDNDTFDGYKMRNVIYDKWGAAYDVDFNRVDSFGFRSLYLNVLPFQWGKRPFRHATELDYLCHLQAVVEILQKYDQLDYVLYQIQETDKRPRPNTSPIVAVPLRLDLTPEQVKQILNY
jgi:Domain of unknown function (DUF3067)